MNQRTRVGVLRGGPSSEYTVSLETGGTVLKVLREKLSDLYQAHDLLIDTTGRWHMDGMPVEIAGLGTKLDIIFNALHGTYGEDGTVQRLLEQHAITYTGSDALASALGMNKVLSRDIFKKHGIKTATGKEVSSEDIRTDVIGVAHELFRSFPLPAVVKPTSGGSSIGVSIARTQGQLIDALTHAARYGDTVLVEEYIAGTEATVGVIDGFRGEELYVLPVVEIRPHEHFFDYEAKYAGKSEEIVPGRFSFEIKEELSLLAQKAHRALGLRHYSRSDFIVSPRRGIYILETNSLPGLTAESLVPKALRSVGSDVHELVHHVIQEALR
jgi:D-alanine-D-alanine ligase